MAEQTSAEPRLLAGGNPQIPKGDGDEPVNAYLRAMPGWKQHVGQRLHDLVVRTVPDVRMAVRWNSPHYGIEGNGWFLSYHCFTRYVRVTWLNGSSLDPRPPGNPSTSECAISISRRTTSSTTDALRFGSDKPPICPATSSDRHSGRTSTSARHVGE
ncbi:DUF1801 domain-containing protein [Agromyces bauzanensis]|uniref:DUF1801 domain-containing protein n=1 Tax=Agromyces bauzanensis TaxID=1308924 RepID=UPI001E45DEDD|nr:DUF1801 domain-containing protein [Agromyces bauzanensis]